MRWSVFDKIHAPFEKHYPGACSSYAGLARAVVSLQVR